MTSETDATFAGLTLDRPRLMGVINATPDSFSDGGDAFAAADAIERGKELLAAGADILDVGGESTRPGAEPVALEEEIRRVVPVVQGLSNLGATVSIDTRHADVMTAAADAGAKIINDVSALTGDAQSLAAAAQLGLPVVLMHMQGEPGSMQDAPDYGDVVSEVRDYLKNRADACLDAGIPPTHIALDPGIGFGKTLDHNLALLGHLDSLVELGYPVLLGVSRKSFIARLDPAAEAGDVPPKARLAGSLAAALKGYAQGARLFRVHDVADTRQAFAVWAAI